jgi:uncharacterized protein YjbI with pentapeptide repeats
MKLYFAALIATFAAASAFVSTSPTQQSRSDSVLFGGIQSEENGRRSPVESFAKVVLASFVSISLLSHPLPAMADGQTEKFRLPPIDKSDKNRCSLNSSSMGQANAARDKLYDLRECSLSGASALGYDLSGVIMTKTDASKVDFKEAYFSKGYLRGKTVLLSCDPCKSEDVEN